MRSNSDMISKINGCLTAAHSGFFPNLFYFFIHWPYDYAQQSELLKVLQTLVFWDMTLCRLVYMNQSFIEACCKGSRSATYIRIYTSYPWRRNNPKSRILTKCLYI